jgi:anti-sigma factor RsiW
MKVTADILKDYVFGELDAAGRREVEAAVAADAGLREELARLQVTQSAMFALREEELPRRIAFVSDKVFEPKWWQVWLNSGPRMAFASAALLAGAIVFHGAAAGPAPVAAPVVQTAAFDEKQFEQRVRDEVARVLPAALEAAEQRHRTQLATVLKEAEGKYQRLRQDDVMAMEASYSLFREKQAAMLVSLAQSGAGGAQ